MIASDTCWFESPGECSPLPVDPKQTILHAMPLVFIFYLPLVYQKYTWHAS